MNTVLFRYGYYIRTKQYEKNPNAIKTRNESRDINENKIVQWLGETLGIIGRLAAEWRWIPFYDVIGNMAGGNKHWRQRRFEPSQEWCFKEDDKWQCVIRIDFIMICECVRSCKFYPKLCLAYGFTLAKSTRMESLQDVPLLNVTSGRPYAPVEVTISLGNIQKIAKNSNFKRHFLKKGWSYRCEILLDNLEDQAQWHISKLCSFY